MRRPKRLRAARPRLTLAMVLAWADDHHQRTGQWPRQKSGRVLANLNENWAAIDNALRNGLRGLPKGDSLGRTIARYRNVRNRTVLPRLTFRIVLRWADAHFARTNQWPKTSSGPVVDAPGETWLGVDMAMRWGCRGFSGGTSLAKLLAAKRSVRHLRYPPKLSVKKILLWADDFKGRTGNWPHVHSGPIQQSPGDSWGVVNLALKRGRRGLLGGSTLGQLLFEKRGAPRIHRWLKPLSEQQILEWADVFFKRMGTWPTTVSGSIPASKGMTWLMIHLTLKNGIRGWPGGTTLAKFLVAHGKGRNRKGLPPFTHDQILEWADNHHAVTGTWPTAKSGRILAAPYETWNAVQIALQRGCRGVLGGSSLLQLLTKNGRVEASERGRWDGKQALNRP